MHSEPYMHEFRDICLQLKVRTKQAKFPYPHGIWQAYVDVCRKLGIPRERCSFQRFRSNPRALEYWFESNKAIMIDRVNLIRLQASANGRPKLLPRSPNAMSADEKRKFLRSSQWHSMRFRILAKYGARCMCCGQTAKHGTTIQVDHIKPLHSHPELRLDPNNLQVLCEMCNMGKSACSMEDFRPKS